MKDKAWHVLITLEDEKFIYQKLFPWLLQAEEKRARNPVPKCPSKLLEPAISQLTGWSSLQGHFGTELRAHFVCRMEYRWPWIRVREFQKTLYYSYSLPYLYSTYFGFSSKENLQNFLTLKLLLFVNFLRNFLETWSE